MFYTYSAPAMSQGLHCRGSEAPGQSLGAVVLVSQVALAGYEGIFSSTFVSRPEICETLAYLAINVLHFRI